MDHVLNWLWQGSAIALVTFALLRALDRSHAAARYVLCWIALIVILLLPIVGLTHAASADAAALAAPAAAHSTALVSVPPAWWTSAPLVIALCALWFTLFTVRTSSALRQVRSARAACRPFPAAVEARLGYWTAARASGRQTQLALSDVAGSAAVLGCGSPVIAVTPTIVRHLSIEELDRVVLHEWAHVQHRDDLLNLVQLAARALAGWHPAVWWLDRQLILEREMACDETVVALTGSRKAYASSLTRVASLVPMQWTRLGNVGALSSHALTRRVVRILSGANRFSLRSSVAAVGVAVLLLGTIGLTVGSLRLVGIASPSELEPAASAATNVRVDAVDSRQSASADQWDGAPESANSPVPTRASEGPRVRRAPVAQSPAAPPETPAASNSASQSTAAAERQDQPGVIPSTPLADVLNTATTSTPTVTQTVTSPYSAAITQSSPDVRPVSAWGAAAGAGVAIGRGSQKAGVATATFFSRVGKKIGQSF